MKSVHFERLSQELAVQLFRRQLTDPKWNASFEPYWKSLPAMGTLHSKEIWENPKHRELLQNDYLVCPSHLAACRDSEINGKPMHLERNN
jgi:hypothetical protein